MSWIHRNTILQVGDRYIVGFSFKLNKVITTRHPKKAKRFRPLEVQEFIRLHGNDEHEMPTKNIRLHIIKPGQQFNPGGTTNENR